MTFTQPWLSEAELLFHRMESFHRQRVESLAEGLSSQGKRKDGFLVVHLIPRTSVQSRSRFDGSKINEHGGKLTAFGDDGSYRTSRFNVDGLYIDNGRAADAYTQIYRDGRLEAVKSSIIIQPNGHYGEPDQQPANLPRYLLDATCEKAVFKLVQGYLSFCQSIGVDLPVTMFSALVGCKDVRFYSRWADQYDQNTIDRSPAYLPELDISTFEVEPLKLLQPWCDNLAQAMGFEKSLNFDNGGKWRERQT